jgi:hypothetical protein
MTSPVPVGDSLASAGRCGASALLVTGLAVVRASEKSAPVRNSIVNLVKRGRKTPHRSEIDFRWLRGSSQRWAWSGLPASARWASPRASLCVGWA